MTAPRINLEEAKNLIKYESVSTDIPSLYSKNRVSIRNKPDWIYFQAPKEINNKGNYYFIEINKDKAPKAFTISILDGPRLLDFKLKLMVKDPAPNRELSEFEKACWKIPYSYIKYY